MKMSIVTICKNAEKALPRTIESVIAQDFHNIEYIIIDGASTDGTLSLLNRYRSSISKIVSEPDGGISDAINKGICLSTGEVIGLLHAGDMSEPQAVSAVMNFFEAHPECDVVHGNISYADSQGRVLYEQGPDLRRDVIWKKMPFHHPACFVRKSAYDKFGLFDTSYKVAMDYELMLRFHVKGAKFGYLDKNLAVMCLEGLSDKNWRRSIAESRRAAISHGMGRLPAHMTELGRLFRTSMTAAYFKLTGRTLRQTFPTFRKQTSHFKSLIMSLRRTK